MIKYTYIIFPLDSILDRVQENGRLKTYIETLISRYVCCRELTRVVEIFTRQAIHFIIFQLNPKSSGLKRRVNITIVRHLEPVHRLGCIEGRERRKLQVIGVDILLT